MVEVLFDKIVLKDKRITGTKLMYFQLLFIAIWAIVPFLLWGHLDQQFFTPTYLTIFAAMILIAIIGNFTYFYSLSKANVCELEPISLLSAPISALLATIIFPSERSPMLFFVILVAVFALIFSRVEKHHLDMNRYSFLMFVHALCVAVEILIIKVMITVSNPVGLYTTRVWVMMLLLTPFFIRSFSGITKKEYRDISLIGGITAFEYFARYIAIDQIGVVKSSLIFLIGPILILLFSNLYLKETITTRRALGDAVIIGCVAFTIFAH